MKPYYQLLNIRALLFGPLAVLVLASCGSYQYAGYDHDGIYSNGTAVAQDYTEEDQTESYDNALYYQQVFSRQANQFETIAESENAIFTDVDSYSSGAYQEDEYVDEGYPVAHGGWGTDADEIAINIYSQPFGFPGYYSYAPYYDPFFYNDFYWNYGYRYGYGPHYGWGWGMHYNPYRYGYGYAGIGYWGSGYYGHGYNRWGYYGNPYSGYARNVAYNNSRRNSSVDYNHDATRSSYLNNRDYRNSDDSRATYRNPRNVRASSRSNSDYTISRSTRVSSDNSRTSGRTSRIEAPQRVRSNRSTSSRDYTPAVRTRTETYQPQQVRSSSSNRSSSGTYRSSYPSTSRSSGTSSGSSRSSRGRGN